MSAADAAWMRVIRGSRSSRSQFRPASAVDGRAAAETRTAATSAPARAR